MAKPRVIRKTYVSADQILARLKGPKTVQVGFPAGTDTDIVMRAFFNEFGTKGSGKPFKTPRGGGFGGPVPERPFMRNAMRANRDKYNSEMRKAAKLLLRGQMPLRTVLSSLGAMAQRDIQQEIRALDSPPNSETTVRIKGSSNPLIDTGEMRQRVTWKVDD